MPDMCLCASSGCPKADTCWRHNAIPDYPQAWFQPEPNVDGCEYFVSMESMNYGENNMASEEGKK
jgi:hypothetical protein